MRLTEDVKSLLKEGWRGCSLPEEDKSKAFSYLANDIVVGATFCCTVWCVRSPANFTAVPTVMWNELEYFMAGIQRTYNKRKEEEKGNVNPYTIKCGMAIAVYFEEEWHRAAIRGLFYNQEKRSYRIAVRLVDFCEDVIVSLDNTQVLLDEHRIEMKALGIVCISQLGPNYNPLASKGPDGQEQGHLYNQNEGWTDADGETFLEIVRDWNVALEMRRHVALPPEGCLDHQELVWEVFTHTVGEKNCQTLDPIYAKINVRHVEREVIRARGTPYVLGDEEETNLAWGCVFDKVLIKSGKMFSHAWNMKVEQYEDITRDKAERSADEDYMLWRKYRLLRGTQFELYEE